MARNTLPKVMPHVFKTEGGYVDHVKDPGGATNLGITRNVLAEWRGRPVSKAEVKALGKSEATEIYRARYWNVVRGDDLPAGLDYAVFDYAINSGPARAAKHLQWVLGIRMDGKIGPQTVAAAKAADVRDTIKRLCATRLDFLRGLKTWAVFGKGWGRRVAEVEKLALKLAAEAAEARSPATAVPPPPDVDPAPTPAPAPAKGNKGLAAGLATLIAAAVGAVLKYLGVF